MNENEYEVFDAHCDTLCRICDSGGNVIENTYNADIKRMQKYKSYTQIFACFISPKYHSAPKTRFEALLNTYRSQNFEGITPLLSLEGGECIESTEDVEYLKVCGIRTIAMTWNNPNRLGGGVSDLTQGLTAFGKSTVAKMNELGIFVDVSHLNDKTFFEVAKITELPLVATHSNLRTVCGAPRNLTDEMFGIIRDSGGVVGINLYPLFVNGTERCTIDDIMRHIDRFMALRGEKSIGIGADFDGTDDVLPEDICGVEGLYKLLDRIRSEYGKEVAEDISHRNFKRIFGG